MKFLIQVVNQASVNIVEKNITNKINKWLLIYVWISREDINANYHDNAFYNQYQTHMGIVLEH